MEGAGLFAWRGHDLLLAGSAAVDNKGRINPGSRTARAVTFSQPWPENGSWENQKKFWHIIASRRWDYKWFAFSARIIVPIMGLNWLISHQKRCLEEQSQNLWSNVSHFTEQLNTEILLVFLLWNHDRCQLLLYSANKFGTFFFHTVESKWLYLSSRRAPQSFLGISTFITLSRLCLQWCILFWVLYSSRMQTTGEN